MPGKFCYAILETDPIIWTGHPLCAVPVGDSDYRQPLIWMAKTELLETFRGAVRRACQISR